MSGNSPTSPCSYLPQAITHTKRNISHLKEKIRKLKKKLAGEEAALIDLEYADYKDKQGAVISGPVKGEDYDSSTKA